MRNLYKFPLIASAALSWAFSSLSAQELPRGSCSSNATTLGILDLRPLCLTSTKKSLDTIKYAILQSGTDADLAPVAERARELASASKMTIERDDADPNFGVLLIASTDPVNIRKSLQSLKVENAESGAQQLDQDLHDFRRFINNTALGYPMTGGETHVVLRRRDGQPIFVVAMVRKTPVDRDFFAVDVRDAMMEALGLSFGHRKARGTGAR